MDNISMRFLGLGRSPRHVAFIMDGNRRFARQNGLPVRDGHQLGYENMERVSLVTRTFQLSLMTF
jgi:ditrans,polycis-polyprenyl diphosphate synthase